MEHKDPVSSVDAWVCMVDRPAPRTFNQIGDRSEALGRTQAARPRCIRPRTPPPEVYPPMSTTILAKLLAAAEGTLLQETDTTHR